MFLWSTSTTNGPKDHVQWCGFHNLSWEVNTEWIRGTNGIDYGLVTSNVVATLVWRDKIVGRFVLETNIVGVKQRNRPERID